MEHSKEFRNRIQEAMQRFGRSFKGMEEQRKSRLNKIQFKSIFQKMRAGFASVIFLIILIIGVSVFSSIQASKASNAVIQDYDSGCNFNYGFNIHLKDHFKINYRSCSRNKQSIECDCK